MTTRTSSETVIFSHPFRLSGVDEVQPAGPYLVETDEELLPTVSIAAYRRVATLIHVARRPGSNELARVVTALFFAAIGEIHFPIGALRDLRVRLALGAWRYIQIMPRPKELNALETCDRSRQSDR